MFFIYRTLGLDFDEKVLPSIINEAPTVALSTKKTEGRTQDLQHLLFVENETLRFLEIFQEFRWFGDIWGIEIPVDASSGIMGCMEWVWNSSEGWSQDGSLLGLKMAISQGVDGFVQRFVPAMKGLLQCYQCCMPPPPPWTSQTRAPDIMSEYMSARMLDRMPEYDEYVSDRISVGFSWCGSLEETHCWWT